MIMTKRKMTPTERKIRDRAIYEDYLEGHYTYQEIAGRYGLGSRAAAWYIVQKEKRRNRLSDKPDVQTSI